MPASRTERPVVSVNVARRLLMHGSGLLSDPTRRAGPAAVRRQIEGMAFVQVDTINALERAHDHLLRSRLHGYRPEMLTKLLERDRCVFEHWTHDASIIPTPWFGYWRRRFDRYRKRSDTADTWLKRTMGDDPQKLIRAVLRRIEREGPLMSRDFEHRRPAGASAWWGWKPQKAALEYLWRIGRLAVVARVSFQKVYDLTSRAFPDALAEPKPSARRHLDWACRTALDHLGTATATELGAFFGAVSAKEAKTWCDSALRTGEILEVDAETFNGSPPRRMYAPTDWAHRAHRLPDPPPGLRLLSPFDPLLRDRRRAVRLCGFDYRFEAFVPAPRRKYGYYVLPLLEGDRLVGRLDPKLDRERGRLDVRKVWWEDGVKETRSRRRDLEAAVDRYARALGADRWSLKTEIR